MSEPVDTLGATTVAPVDEVEVDSIRDRGWRDQTEAGVPAYRVLLASVRSCGVVVPLVVRAVPEGGYRLVSGARRLQAAREAGRRTVPVLVRELGEAEALIGGAWVALTRSGVSAEEAEQVRGRLVAAGVTEDEADLLAGSLPRAEGVELTGRVDAQVQETGKPAWAWGGTSESAEPRRGRRWPGRSGR